MDLIPTSYLDLWNFYNFYKNVDLSRIKTSGLGRRANDCWQLIRIRTIDLY